MSYNLDDVRPGPQRWKRALDAAKDKPNSYHAKLLYERLYRASGLFDLDGDDVEHYWRVTRDAPSSYSKQTRHYYCSDFCFALASHLEAWITEDGGTHYSSYEELIKDIDDAVFGRQLYIGWGRSHYPLAEAILPRSLSRAVKCFTCGGKMSRDEFTCENPLISRVDFLDSVFIAVAWHNSQPTAAPVKKDEPLADWERELLDGVREELKVEQQQELEKEAVKVLVDEDGRIVEKQPQITEVLLTPSEARLLKYVPAHLRLEALDQIAQLDKL